MAGSFWSNFSMRMPTSSGGGIDEILEKGEGNFTLEEIISHDQVIQECKYMNQAVCEYLSKPHIIRQLVQYVITPPPPEPAGLPTSSLDVGGCSDNDGGITTAASIRRRKERERLLAEKKAAAAAAKAAAAASSSTSEAKSSETTEDGSSSTNTTLESKDNDSASDNEEDEELEKMAMDQTAADKKAEAEQKYPYQASELFSCEVPSMLDALFEPEDPSSLAASANSTATNTPLAKVAEGEEDEQKGDSSPITSSSSTEATSITLQSPPLPSNVSPPPTTSTSPTSATPTASSSSSTSSTTVAPATSSSPSTPRLPMLDLLFSFLDQPAPIDPAHASYFRKVMVVLIQRKYEPLVRYMAANNILNKLLRHIGLYSIMEILIMIGWDDGLGGNQDVAWLVANDLTGKLIEKLNPIWETEYNQPDVIINSSRALVDVVVKCPAPTHNPLITRLLATPCQELLFKHMFSGSLLSLSNALSIVIVLVQRYANRMDLGEEIMDEVKAAALAAQAASLDAPEDDHTSLATAASLSENSTHTIPEPFHSLVPHLATILKLLQTEQPKVETWSYGRGRAFGETRLKVVELILVLVRCKVVEVEEIFRKEGLLGQLLEAFSAYPWNNMLHGLVESITRTILEFLTNTCLKPALFLDAGLTDRMIEAYNKNTEACKKGKGFRLGYMGHLLRTSEVIEQYLKAAELESNQFAVANPGAQNEDGTNASSSANNVTSSSSTSSSAPGTIDPTIRVTILGSQAAVDRWAAFISGPLAAEIEAAKVVLPPMGGVGEDDFGADAIDDTDALAQNYLNNGGGTGSTSAANKKAAVEHQADYVSFDPDDTGNMAYDYSSQMESGGNDSAWADFNTHFDVGESAAGNSPNAAFSSSSSASAAGTSAASSVSAAPSLPSVQRQLMEFHLNPDEDAYEPDEEEENQDQDEHMSKWMNAGVPTTATNATANATESASATASSSSTTTDATSSSTTAATTTTASAAAFGSGDDDWADFSSK